MRKVLTAVAGGAVAIMLAAPPAHAAAPANSAQRSAAQSSQIERRHRNAHHWDRDRYDDGGGRDGYDGGGGRDGYDDRWDGCHRHGLVGALLHWLI